MSRSDSALQTHIIIDCCQHPITLLEVSLGILTRNPIITRWLVIVLRGKATVFLNFLKNVPFMKLEMLNTRTT